MRPASLPLRALAFLALLGVRALAAAEETQPTVITSDSLEARSTDTRTYSTFSGHVVVAGTNIKITCDRLEVISTRSGGKAEAIGTQSQFEHLEAIGHVLIAQGDREATCGRAEVFPGEDRIVLTENPVVKIEAEHYEAKGPRMVLYRGQRRAVIEGSPQERTHISLPAIKDLGFPSENPSK